MDLESRKYLVISTHRGLFRYTRLPFGFHGALAIFQSAIDMILHGLSGVAAYLDDILITGTDEQEHLPRLRWLFQRLLAAGVRLKKEMCSFGLRSLTYLGQVMDCAGTRPDPTKVRTITNCLVKTNAVELRSFLGTANYYRKFIPAMSQTCAPLYALTKLNVKFEWGPKQQFFFEAL